MNAHDRERDDEDSLLRALAAAARAERDLLAEAIPSGGPYAALDADERAGIVAAITAQRTREQRDALDEAGLDRFGLAEVPEGDAAEDDADGAELADAQSAGFDDVGLAAAGLPAGPGDAAMPLADVARPRPPRRYAGVAATLLAIAAAVAFYVMRPTGPALPVYTLETLAGAQIVRGEEANAPYAPGTRFRFLLRPATPPTGAVTASVELRGPDGVVDWQPPVTIGAGGGVKVEGTFDGALALPPGSYTVLFTVKDDDETRQMKHRFEMAAAAP